ncbi:MAG: SPASM domain-containing protein [Acidobacteriota bacterium]|nr:SPASM domain-containing protein [Acidobacteriota bacterium]
MRIIRPGGQIVNWEIAFAQGCNLRCAYCSSGFGQFGAASPSFMERPVWERLAGLIASESAPGGRVNLDVQGGETFLRARDFLAFVDAVRDRAGRKKTSVTVQVTTNGTIFDPALRDACFERQIKVIFSLDGPASLHDRNRRTGTGKGSHRTAMAHWRSYRDLARSKKNPSLCRVQSVYTGDMDLARLEKYWLRRGERLFQCLVQESSRFQDAESRRALSRRRAKYLRDFRKSAMDHAAALTVPDFLSRYRGTDQLFEFWTTKFLGGSPSQCAAGIAAIGVDASGILYPCLALIGSDRWAIGDVRTGIDRARRERFLRARARALRPCGSCRIRDYCRGGCPAAGPGDDLALNSQEGCAFMMNLVGIAHRAYAVMESQ